MDSETLVQAEREAGGYTGLLPAGARSPLGVQYPYMQGGDRMEMHGYAPSYARHLPRDPRVIVEVGVLTGVGLRMWQRLFPSARVVGFDYDLSNCGAHTDTYVMDQYTVRAMDLSMLDLGSVDVYVDDASHEREATRNCFKAFLPYLAPRAVCFIEDAPGAAEWFSDLIGPEWTVTSYDLLTVLARAAPRES